jgi:hypothetical protein
MSGRIHRWGTKPQSRRAGRLNYPKAKHLTRLPQPKPTTIKIKDSHYDRGTTGGGAEALKLRLGNYGNDQLILGDDHFRNGSGNITFTQPKKTADIDNGDKYLTANTDGIHLIDNFTGFGGNIATYQILYIQIKDRKDFDGVLIAKAVLGGHVAHFIGIEVFQNNGCLRLFDLHVCFATANNSDFGLIAGHHRLGDYDGDLGLRLFSRNNWGLLTRTDGRLGNNDGNLRLWLRDRYDRLALCHFDIRVRHGNVHCGVFCSTTT